MVFGSEPDKDRKNKTIGNLAVKAVAWDTTLGGAAFTSKLCAPLAPRAGCHGSEASGMPHGTAAAHSLPP